MDCVKYYLSEYKTYLFSSFFILTMVFVSVFIAYTKEYEIIKQEQIQYAFKLTNIVEQRISTLVEVVDTCLRGLQHELFEENTEYTHEKYTEENQKINIENHGCSSTLLKQVVIVNEKGFVTYTNAPKPPSTSLGPLIFRDYFQYHLKTISDQIIISPLYKGKFTGEYQFRLSRRLSKPDGSFNGVIFIGVRSSDLTQFFGEILQGKESSITITHIQTKSVIARYPELSSKISEKEHNASEFGFWSQLKQNINTGSFTKTSDIDGIVKEFVFKNTALGVVISIGISTNDIYEQTKELKYWFIFVFVVIFICNILGLYSIITNTETKKKILKLSQAKSHFLTNITHELRTPLNSVIGFAELIKDESYGKIEQKDYVEFAKDIYIGGNHLLAIVNDALDVAKIESGKMILNIELYDPRFIITTAIRMLMLEKYLFL